MRVVLDTNILVPANIYRYWEAGRFTLLSCAEQWLELRSTLQKPTLRRNVKRPQFNRGFTFGHHSLRKLIQGEIPLD